MANKTKVRMFVDAPMVPKSVKTFEIPAKDAKARVAMSAARADYGTATHSSATTYVFEVVAPASEDEDEYDIRAARAARAEDATPIPYSEFRKELGL